MERKLTNNCANNYFYLIAMKSKIKRDLGTNLLLLNSIDRIINMKMQNLTQMIYYQRLTENSQFLYKYIIKYYNTIFR